MLNREIIAVYSHIYTKHVNTMCGQNEELFLAVYKVTTGLYKVPVPLTITSPAASSTPDHAIIITEITTFCDLKKITRALNPVHLPSAPCTLGEATSPPTAESQRPMLQYRPYIKRYVIQTLKCAISVHTTVHVASI